MSGFQMVDKMVAVCPDFKWLGFPFVIQIPTGKVLNARSMYETS